MLKRTLLTTLAAAATLAFAASAQAAYLTLGTTNTSNVTTALSGNSAGSELLIKNTNGSSPSAFGVYGLLTPTSPTVNATAVRGQNSATNGRGYGVYGSQAGSGTGVRGFAPTGKGVWGSSTSGTGLLGQHTATTGTAPGVSASTSSTDANADAFLATVTPTSPGLGSTAVNGINNGTGSNGIGVSGSQAGSGVGVLGTAASGIGVRAVSGGDGVYALSTGSGDGVYAYSTNGRGVEASGTDAGVLGTGTVAGVKGGGTTYGVYGTSGSYGVFGTGGIGVEGNGTTYGVFGDSSGKGVEGHSSSGNGVYAQSSTGDAISATTGGTYASGIYAENTGAGDAAYLEGPVYISGGCTGCTGPSALHIDDPLDPTHKYLNHASVVSSQQLDVYSGNVRTNGKGFATVHMPRWFQALNRSFRYQLTSLSGLQQVAVAKEMHHNRFTIQSQRPHSKVSWQVSAVRHDRYAQANPTRVIVSKAKADQGKYVHPQVYGKPKRDALGYQKPPRPSKVKNQLPTLPRLPKAEK
jgi:hypothetical protein